MTEIIDNKDNQSQDRQEFLNNPGLEIQADAENAPASSQLNKNKQLVNTVILLSVIIFIGIWGADRAKFKARNTELEKAAMAVSSRDANQIIKEMMVKCPAGEFMMGSPTNELGRRDDEVQHKVRISQDFYISKYPITQMMYMAIMGDNPSRYKDDNCPVESVNWFKAKEFCQRLNIYTNDSRPAGYEFDLPTEAQWEYACRAGTKTSLNSGKEITVKNGSCYNLEEVAWYEDNSDARPHQVGLKLPNAWGIYDMHGNVWEWCRDYYGNYPTDDVVDPEGPETGYFRSDRGGSWINYYPSLLRSANRFCRNPNYEYNFLGFRIVLVSVKK